MLGNKAKGATSHNFRFALISLTSLFFMWGFLTSLNDILIPYLKGMFSLSFTQAMLIQFCFFGAYFIVSIPAGKLVSKIGFQSGIVVGLVIAAIGCALFFPAAEFHIYGVFLLALFILASGITILQVSANPYVGVLGPEKTASSRLTLTQAFNSLGTTVAPLLGGWLILSSISAATAEQVKMPYLAMSVTLLLMAFIFSQLDLPKLGKEQDNDVSHSEASHKLSFAKHKQLFLGALGIFMYVGAEVSIGSFLVSFITLESVSDIQPQTAGHYISFYFAGAMIGRFIGAALMQRIDASKVLAVHAIIAIVLICCAVFGSGSLAMWALLAVGLCNSIMFPTIFSLSLRGLGDLTSKGSGVLCLAIVGGAVLPLLQGALADNFGVQSAMALPIVSYLYISYFAKRSN
ncbi:sugar MFS transporter [Pseudoalteromonas prydzensis]|uniref:sugar MFS transporter n=1 Tax=Pseudoalteromonas prydzensis TaxID=182141 RepID=UPI0007E51E61|nr:sugar MFS transporter [Pseudoalteromonas prydzensis]MBE0378656.1 MFS transporter, FHS family, L-fucose permease [Pseudoalteromonas prydzensis ACAM 620]